MAFIYYNRNPSGDKIEDCVNRAISLATDTDYWFIYYLLYDNSESRSCDMLTKGCYRQILEDYFGLTPQYGRGRTVDEIAQMYKNDRVIMRTKGHAVASINGDIYDLFDCRDYIVDEYWVVE